MTNDALPLLLVSWRNFKIFRTENKQYVKLGLTHVRLNP